MVCPSIYWTVCWSSTRNPIPNNKFGKSLKQDARKRMWKWRKVLCNYWLQLEWKQLCVMLSSWSQPAHCWQQKEKQVRLTNLMLLEPIQCSWMWRDRAITWRTIRANIYSAKKPKPTQAQEWMKKNDVNEIKFFLLFVNYLPKYHTLYFITSWRTKSFSLFYWPKFKKFS